MTISLPEPTAKPDAWFSDRIYHLVWVCSASIDLTCQVPPIRVLKRDYHVSGLGQFSRYGFALCAVGALGYLYSDDLLLTGWVVIAVIILVGLVAGLGRLVIWGLGPLEHVGPAWRFGIQQLVRDPQASGGQLMAFALTALAIAMVALIRFDLITTWETQVPTDGPIRLH